MILLAWACSTAPPEASAVREPPTAAAMTAADEGTWEGGIRRLDEALRAAEARALKYDNDWARWEEVAGLAAQRARLSGDLADWARAEDAYTVAFAMAPPGSGPLLGRATLNLALHRLDRVEPDLATFEKRVLLDDPQRAELSRLRGDVALQQGRLDEARERYATSLGLSPTMAARYGEAHVAWQRGDHEAALAGLDACEALVKGDQPTTRMWLALQRGLVELSRRRFEAALVHYEAADTHVSGHWLIREHIAEVTNLLGRPEEALAMYREIVLQTRNPEFMDAVAEILASRGDEAGAERWAAWAEAGFERQLATYPEAAAGHALDHFLAFGEPARAVALAEQNAALRPNGEALTKLAAAYRKAGRRADAEAALDRAAATGWVSADLTDERELLASLPPRAPERPAPR